MIANTELFQLIKKEKESFWEITNLESIVEIPSIEGFQLALVDKKALFMSYSIVNLLCEKNWKDMGKDKLFTLAHFSYKVEMTRTNKAFAIAQRREREEY